MGETSTIRLVRTGSQTHLQVVTEVPDIIEQSRALEPFYPKSYK